MYKTKTFLSLNCHKIKFEFSGTLHVLFFELLYSTVLGRWICRKKGEKTLFMGFLVFFPPHQMPVFPSFFFGKLPYPTFFSKKTLLALRSCKEKTSFLLLYILNCCLKHKQEHFRKEKNNHFTSFNIFSHALQSFNFSFYVNNYVIFHNITYLHGKSVLFVFFPKLYYLVLIPFQA